MTAEQLYQEGKYQEALVAYHKLIQTNPVVSNYIGLSKAYYHLNHRIHAIAALQEALQIDPNHIEARLFLTQYYHLSNDFASAKTIIEPLYAQHPTDDKVACMYMSYLIGIQDFKTAKTLLPLFATSQHTGILNNVGLIHIELGDMRSAMKTFRKALRLIIANPLPAAAKQQGFMEQGGAKVALLAIKKALDELGTPFMLAAGTLLGIYRDGEILPHDKDIDLMLPWNTPRAELINALRHYQFACNFSEEAIVGERGRWNIILTHIPTGTTIDLFFLKPEGNKLIHSIYKNGKILSIYESNVGRGQIEYAGETFWTYGDIELYFREKYGEDWRVPKANHNGLILSNRDGRTHDPHGIGIALCYNHCLSAFCEALYKKAHGYCLQILSVHSDPLLELVKNYLEQNLSEEWYPPIPLCKKRTNNKDLYKIKD